MQKKIDLKRTLRRYFTAPKKEWAEEQFGPLSYLMIDGEGAPGSPAYVTALETLYPAAYTMKFHSKTVLYRDYVVPPLEGLWWSNRLDAYTENRRDEWCWTMMLMLPDWIEPEHLVDVRKTLMRKKPDQDFSSIRMDILIEGECLQRLHLGPFAEEGPVLAALHEEVMPARRVTFAGHHHEIYLSDPRRTEPAKLRTILRQPIKPVD